MPSGLEPIHSSKVSRTIYILSILLVFSYVFFDVLDLDGSSLLRLLAPVKRTVTVAVMPSDTQINHSFDHSELRDHSILLIANRSGLDVRLSRAVGLSSPALRRARCHGYRVGLARNSLPDSYPYL
jgi:hypothetical protein